MIARNVVGARSLRDWQQDPELLKPPAILLPYLVAEGRVTLFSGREKIGKSTMAGSAVAAASRGDPVLGVPIAEKLHTLWYSIDEPVGDTIRRFTDLQADPDRVHLNVEPRTLTELLEAIVADTTSFPSHLVVIDNLSRVFDAMGIDANSKSEAGPVVGRLVDFFHNYNLSALVLYHTGKGGREYTGSQAIGASVDDILTLRKRGQARDEDDFDDDATDDGRRLLVREGRNLRGRVQFACTDGVYRLYDEAHPPRTKILETLRDHGTVDSRTDLAKLSGVRKATALETIRALIGEGAITESNRRLSIAPLGISELHAAVPKSVGQSGTGGTGAPALTPLSSGSRRFPVAGTVAEPAPEPMREPGDALCVPGSQEEARLLARLEAERAA